MRHWNSDRTLSFFSNRDFSLGMLVRVCLNKTGAFARPGNQKTAPGSNFTGALDTERYGNSRAAPIKNNSVSFIIQEIRNEYIIAN